MDEFLNAACQAGVEHVLRADDGGAFVLCPATFHGRAAVNHRANSLHRALHRLRIAKIAERDLHIIRDSFRNSTHENTHLPSLGAQTIHDRTPQRARSAGHENGCVFQRLQRHDTRRVVLIGGSCDLFRPAHDPRGIGHGDRHRAIGGQRVIKLRHQILQPLIWPHFSQCISGHVQRHLEQRLERITQGIEHAFRRPRDRHGAAQRFEHEKQIDTQNTLRTVDDQLALKRFGVPGKLELSHSFAALYHRAPFIKGQIRIAAQTLPRRAHLFDRTEKRLKQIERMYTEVTKWIAGGAILWRKRPAFVGRIDRAAKDVQRDDFSDLAGAHQLQRPSNMRIEQQ